MKRLSLIFLLLLTVFPALGQAPIRRQFFTTNDNPIVDVVAGSNATVQASTPAANVRRFTVNAVPTVGQTNDTYLVALTNIVIVTNVVGTKTIYSIGGMTDTNVINALAGNSQIWTNDAGRVYLNLSKGTNIAVGTVAQDYVASPNIRAVFGEDASLGGSSEYEFLVEATSDPTFENDSYLDLILSSDPVNPNADWYLSSSSTNNTVVFRVRVAPEDQLNTFFGLSDLNGLRFRLDGDGNLSTVRGVSYQWPGANDVGLLLNDGVGNLSWSTNIGPVTNFYFYSTNLYYNDTYVSNYFVNNVYVDTYVSNYLFTNIYVTNQYVSNLYATNIVNNNTYVSNFWQTNIFVNDSYVSNYYTTNIFNNFVTNIINITFNYLDVTNATLYGTTTFQGVNTAGFNGTNFYGDGSGLTNLSGGSQVWTNSGSMLWQSGSPKPTASIGTPFFISTNGSYMFGSNSLGAGLDLSTIPFYALSVVDSNQPTELKAQIEVIDNLNDWIDDNFIWWHATDSSADVRVGHSRLGGSSTLNLGADSSGATVNANTNGQPIFDISSSGIFGVKFATLQNGIYYGNGSGLTNLPSGGTGSSNITDNAYYAVARNLTVNTNAEINNLVVTNLTVDSGSGIGVIELENSGTNIISLNGTNGTITSVTNVAQYVLGDGSGLTNLSVVGLSNITDSGYVAVARNLTVSTNTTFGGSVISTNGYTSTGTNAIYSLWSSGTDYERYLFEPEDTRLTIRADTAGSGDDNLSVRVMPVGTGAFYLSGGTLARGTYSVDLQLYNSDGNAVASGNAAFASGFNNRSYGTASSAMGRDNKADALYSLAVNAYGFATNDYTLSQGLNGVARLFAQSAHSSGKFSTTGDVESSRLVAFVVSTSNNATNVWLDGASLRLTLPENTSWSFQIQITARSTDAGTGDEESAAYEIKGLIERDNSAAATRLVGSPIITTIAENDAAWDVWVTADTTNGALQINVVGNNETAVRWVATVHLTEVGG